MSLIQDGVNNEAAKFGIEIVDVRIKRADLPPANSDAIYRRMQTERERKLKSLGQKVLRWQSQLHQPPTKKLLLYWQMQRKDLKY